MILKLDRLARWPLQHVRTVGHLIQDYVLMPFRPASLQVIRFRVVRISSTFLACGALWLIALAVVHVWDWYDRAPHESRWYREAGGQDGGGLVVIVHGWVNGPQDMEPVASVVGDQEGFQRHAIYLWGYESNRFSNKDPGGLADDLASKIAELHQKTKGEIILIGHSLGGLLLRRAFITGLENNQEWSHAVTRMILLAAPNRGTEATSRSPWLWLGDGLARSFGVGQLIRATYRGAPFIVDLRLDWIQRFRTLPDPPIVTQILGTEDAVVRASDSIDLVQFPNSIQFQLPNSSHESIIRSEESGLSIRQALMRGKSRQSSVAEAAATNTIKLLVVHGIRDYGERFDEIRDSVKNYASQRGVTVEASAPRYRYFSALQFINPISRLHKIYEFADIYTEMLATPPIDAPIHFVGHSFGTFLMGKGMELYNSIKFERVYLAGSVLDEDFFANHKYLGNRIKYLRNDVATRDWPVGILCSGIAGLGLADDVGTGGFNGFTRIVTQNRYDEIKYFNGGHGKALESVNIPTIADWLLQEAGTQFDMAQVKGMLTQATAVVNDRDSGDLPRALRLDYWSSLLRR
jgi:pimeloyl-ACP methyl ester carboxylesterase